MNENSARQPIAVKNLADFKRHIQPGTEILIKSHAIHPDLIGLTRVVTKVQTNGFYSVIKGQQGKKLLMFNGFWRDSRGVPEFWCTSSSDARHD